MEEKEKDKQKQKEILVMTSLGVMVPLEAIKDYIPERMKQDLNTVEEAKSTVDPTLEVGHYVITLANKIGWNPLKLGGMLDSIWKINPSAAFSIILKEIAIELDKKYTDHISKCEEVFVVSTLDGRIHKTPKAHIKNFRNFAAFRTLEDARTACKILKSRLKIMFSSSFSGK